MYSKPLSTQMPILQFQISQRDFKKYLLYSKNFSALKYKSGGCQLVYCLAYLAVSISNSNVIHSIAQGFPNLVLHDKSLK